jgi:hypothetical protein
MFDQSWISMRACLLWLISSSNAMRIFFPPQGI